MNLEPLRVKESMSREDLARRMGVSYMTVRNWERGNTEPSATQIKALADLFGVSTDYLLGR